ncbi:MAG: hypothetical protein AAFO83_11480, partial [Cyanobacteria bacterium J06607_13]
MNVSHGEGSPMQGNQKNWRSIIAGSRLLIGSLTLASTLTLHSVSQKSAKATPPAFSQTTLAQTASAPPTLAQATPAQTSPPTPSQTQTDPVQTDTTQADTTAVPAPVQLPITQQRNPESTLTNLVTLMLGLLVLMVSTGIVMLWFYRRSVVNEVATIVRTQLNEMTELENKVHNATRNLNRVLAEADDLSGELQGRSSNFQREIAAQREVLYTLVDELAEFKVQTAKNWEQELENINGKLEATATDFTEVAIALRQQAQAKLDTLQSETEVEGQRILQRFTTSETEFSRHIGVIKEETQRRKTAFFDELDRKESVLSDQMG